MTKIITHSEIVEKADLRKAMDTLKGNEGESQYFSYELSKGRRVIVQSTASRLMDNVTQFLYGDQERYFQAIVDELPEPGDSLMIHDEETGKRRMSFIARVKGDEDGDTVYLLITR
jgi:hypothetical protein